MAFSNAFINHSVKVTERIKHYVYFNVNFMNVEAVNI
nr:MAG TPA_asm: hypothetical protein [Caudoviricetes sp.]